ncbi:acetyl-CoA carboxylase, biotin carboxyl carrier protein [PVC group bacterium (ex Bugula neritina AB1)]|nr:acetyl-CoA carboxylase, biotin carboxyl carrier protein [PVC group bacterium (ex Bugula neritina AB1)]
MNLDMRQLKKILNLMNDNDLAEVSVKNGEDEISLRKHEAVVASQPVERHIVQSVDVPLKADAPSEKTSASKEEETGNPIVSPMVGTFYRSPTPDASSFVNVGDSIEVGQTLCILEAMKLMNEFKSEVSGRISKILVKNGEAVEFGQPLFLVED